MEFDYNKIIEMDNVTVQDCIDMYQMRNKCSIINDGKIINFESEE